MDSTTTDPQIEKLLKAINLIRWLEREFPAQLIATLLYIGSHNPCSKQDLEEALKFTTASGSRNTDWLSKYHRLRLSDGTRKKGLNLIKKEVDPLNKRRQLLSLTKTGEDLMQQLKQILYE